MENVTLKNIADEERDAILEALKGQKNASEKAISSAEAENSTPDLENKSTANENETVSAQDGILSAYAKNIHIPQEANFKTHDNTVIGISEDEIRSLFPADMPDNIYQIKKSELLKEIEMYRKDLVMNEGFTSEEARVAALNRLKKKANEESVLYKTQNPDEVTVVVDKTQKDNISFTEDERDKLRKSKVIHLRVMDDAELSTINVKKIEPERLSSAIRCIDGGLSTYSVPLPIVGDFVTFKGASTVAFAKALYHTDDTTVEKLNKEAQFIYERLIGGAIYSKKDQNGNIIMNYDEFKKTFYTMDTALATYAIYVASSMEESETSLTCTNPKCKQSFEWKYNVKGLLDLSDIPEEFQEKFNTVIANKVNPDILQKYAENMHLAKRIKSPFTKNIYEISCATIAKSLDVRRVLDEYAAEHNGEIDQIMYLLATMLEYIDAIYIYDVSDTSGDSYIEIRDNGTIDRYKLMIEALEDLSEVEYNIIMGVASKMSYDPKFVLKSKCPYCAQQMENELSVIELIFLKARDTQVEISL